MEKIPEYLSKYAGAIIGVLIAIVLIAVGIIHVLIALIVIVAFAFLGNYVQRNKDTVKEKLKAFIDKI